MAGSNNQATDAVAKAETTINKKIINSNLSKEINYESNFG